MSYMRAFVAPLFLAFRIHFSFTVVGSAAAPMWLTPRNAPDCVVYVARPLALFAGEGNDPFV